MDKVQSRAGKRSLGWVVVAFVLAACVACAGTTAPLPVATEVVNKSVDLKVLVTKSDSAGKIVGATSPVTIESEPGTDGEFKLASIESEVNGTGDQWNASEWAGSAVAIMMTGRNPADVRLSFDVAGPIDGPSAGAIMTVAAAAAMNGHDLRPGVSMTGTINPDGTIGPVGGIPHKIQGAKDAGITTVLIPSGLSQSTDLNTGETVDVVAIGKQLGVDVREVSNVQEAYEAFTGQKVSQGPAPITTYQFNDSTIQVFNQKIATWLALYQKTAAENAERYEAVAENFNVSHFANLAAENAALATKYQQAGNFAAAYDAATYAAYLELQVNQLGKGAQAAAKDGANGLQIFINESGSITRDTEAVLEKFLNIEPKNISEMAWLTGAYSSLFEGLARSVSAKELLERESASPEAAAATIQTVIERNAQAEVLLEVAIDMLDLAGPGSGGPIDNPDIEALTKFFDQVADANLALFDATVIAEAAKSAGIGEAKAKANFASRNSDYEDALLTDNVIRLLKENGEDRKSFQYAQLGASLNRYVTSAELIAKFYSLDAQLDPKTMAITDLPVTPKVEAMFKASEDQVLRGAARLQEANIDPTPAMVLYEMGVFEIDEAIEAGDGGLLLTGLSSMWQAQLLTSMMANYGGVTSNS